MNVHRSNDSACMSHNIPKSSLIESRANIEIQSQSKQLCIKFKQVDSKFFIKLIELPIDFFFMIPGE